MRVVIVGVPGVGKTTVVDRLNALLKGSELVNFGTLMLEHGLRLKWVKHRDELRKLSVEKQRTLQTFAAAAISRMKAKAVIVDTHLFIRTKEGYWPGIPFEVARALKPTHLVLVEASAEEVLTRRARDKGRYRDGATKEDLALELELARGYLPVISTLTGAPSFIVENSEGGSDRAAEKVARVLRESTK